MSTRDDWQLAERYLNDAVRWAAQLVDVRPATEAVAESAARWFRTAAAGIQTTAGPYAEFYYYLADEVSQRVSVWAGVTPNYVIGAIPIPQVDVSCEVSRIYALVRMLALYGEWTTAEVLEISQQIRSDWFAYPGSDKDLETVLLSAHASSLLRRAVEVTEAHECVGDEKCRECADLWQYEDSRSDYWVARKIAQQRG